MSTSGTAPSLPPARPLMVVVAGPAGSGKTTVFPLVAFGVDPFSVDDRCAELNGGSYVGIPASVRARAGDECRAFIEEHIASKRSFAVETTLRTQVAIAQAAAARREGFWTLMLFLTTEDVRINIDRIIARGLFGGHSSPEDDIRRIFEASMANLPDAVAVFDRIECFDNTAVGRRPARVLAFEHGRVVGKFAPLPRWAAALAGGEESR